MINEIRIFSDIPPTYLYQTQQENTKPYKFTMSHHQKLQNGTGAETLLLFHIPEKVDFVGVGVSTHPVSPLAFPEWGPVPALGGYLAMCSWLASKLETHLAKPYLQQTKAIVISSIFPDALVSDYFACWLKLLKRSCFSFYSKINNFSCNSFFPI